MNESQSLPDIDLNEAMKKYKEETISRSSLFRLFFSNFASVEETILTLSDFFHRRSANKAFVEDTARLSNTVVLELGAGMNTPVVLRWHDEDLVRESEGNVRMIRAGIGAAGCAPWDMEERNEAVGIEGELDHVLDVLIDSPSIWP